MQPFHAPSSPKHHSQYSEPLALNSKNNTRGKKLSHALRFISDYIHEVCQCSLLPYEDYALIEMWLKHSSGDLNRVLLILSEVLEEYHRRKQCHPNTLKLIHNQVMKRLAIS